VRAGDHNVVVQNALGAIGSTPAFSPKLQYNLRARYDWSVSDYNAFVQVGMSHVDDMANEPSSFDSGEGVVVPTTTWLRYKMPGYNTYDASLGFAKGAWDVLIFGQNLSNVNASTFTTSGQDIRAEVPLRPRVLRREGRPEVLTVAVQSKGGQQCPPLVFRVLHDRHVAAGGGASQRGTRG